MSRFRNGKSLINQALFLSVGGQPVLLSLAPKNSLKWRIWASQTYPETKGATDMSDNRKYYYLKLKENYFDEDSIVLPESMQDGILHSYILLKLYLKSLKHDSRPSSPTRPGTAISCPAVYVPASRTSTSGRNLGAFRPRISRSSMILRSHRTISWLSAIWSRACAGLDRGKTNAEKRMFVSTNIRILPFLSVTNFVYKSLHILFTGNSHSFGCAR